MKQLQEPKTLLIHKPEIDAYWVLGTTFLHSMAMPFGEQLPNDVIKFIIDENITHVIILTKSSIYGHESSHSQDSSNYIDQEAVLIGQNTAKVLPRSIVICTLGQDKMGNRENLTVHYFRNPEIIIYGYEHNADMLVGSKDVVTRSMYNWFRNNGTIERMNQPEFLFIQTHSKQAPQTLQFVPHHILTCPDTVIGMAQFLHNLHQLAKTRIGYKKVIIQQDTPQDLISFITKATQIILSHQVQILVQS